MNWGRSGGKQCADLEEWISAYADGQTARSDSEAVEAHLADCARCGAFLRRHRRTKGLLRLASGDSWTPPDLRLLIAHGIASDQRPTRRPLWGMGLAACLVFVMLVGAFSVAEHSGWNSASKVTAPRPSPITHAVLNNPSAGRIACSHASGRTLARCQGVSPPWLPTVLAEERAEKLAAARLLTPAISPPLLMERHASTPKAPRVDTKGGIARALTTPGQHGLIPV